MDTKWNNTAKAALPGETAEAPYTGSPRKRQVKAVAAFLAFFFGLSLVLGSLGAALGRWAWQRGSGDITVADWQERRASVRRSPPISGNFWSWEPGRTWTGTMIGTEAL